LRDRDHLVPMAASDTTLPLFVVRYAPETELKAGRSFEADIRAMHGGRLSRSPTSPRMHRATCSIHSRASPDKRTP
jgi:hypothetical protein